MISRETIWTVLRSIRIHWIYRMVLFSIKQPKVKLAVLIIIILALLFLNLKSSTKDTYLPPGHHVDDFKALQPEVNEDFPTISGDVPRIPHIIHQTYRDTLVPGQFLENVKTFMKNNPKWKYYFWTDESARKLIAERHPDFLSTWDNYRSGVNKADALRYIVLYEFGGIYADLDVENLRPLDRATMKYSCIFPPEPLEQPILRLHLPYLINNAIMMCRPKHPFLKQMISALPLFRTMADQIDLAGPCFVTLQYLAYNNISADQYAAEKQQHTDNSPYFYSGPLPGDHVNGVYVPNTRYFMDTLDVHEPGPNMYHDTCTKTFEELPLYKQRACAELQRRGLSRKQSPYTFTIHQWAQTYFNYKPIELFMRSLYIPAPIDIHSLAPNVIIY